MERNLLEYPQNRKGKQHWTRVGRLMYTPVCSAPPQKGKWKKTENIKWMKTGRKIHRKKRRKSRTEPSKTFSKPGGKTTQNQSGSAHVHAGSACLLGTPGVTWGTEIAASKVVQLLVQCLPTSCAWMTFFWGKCVNDDLIQCRSASSSVPQSTQLLVLLYPRKKGYGDRQTISCCKEDTAYSSGMTAGSKWDILFTYYISISDKIDTA